MHAMQKLDIFITNTLKAEPPTFLMNTFMISKSHIIAQKPRRTQMCAVVSAISVIYCFLLFVSFFI